MRWILVWILSALFAVAAHAGSVCAPGQYLAEDGACRDAVVAHSIFRAGGCYSIDGGQLIEEDVSGKWTLFYGAVSDRSGVSSCKIGGYSEDIWMQRGRYTRARGWQAEGAPVLLLSSLALRKYTGIFQPDRDDMPGSSCAGARCSGWNIGEPAVARIRGRWIMVFDAQTCAQAAVGAQYGMFVAVSQHPDRDWQIVGRFDDLPGSGRPPYAFPRLVQGPRHEWYLYYVDSNNHVRVASLHLKRGLPVFHALPEPVLPKGAASSLHAYFDPATQQYWAVADNYGEGRFDDLHSLWLLGPSSSPVHFRWDQRRSFLVRGGAYAGAIRFPLLARGKDGWSVYFFGKRTAEHLASCSPDTSQTLGVVPGLRLSSELPPAAGNAVTR